MQSLNVDFEVIVGVIAHGKYSPEDTARYYASFSNVHGQNLTNGEKSKSAYNALSVMNLRKDEGDDSLRPFMNDRDLGSLLGVSKSTVSNQRQILVKQRYGTGDPNDPITGDDAVNNAVNQVANMENNAPDSTSDDSGDDSNTSEASDDTNETSEQNKDGITRQDGGEQATDDRAKGTDGINVNVDADDDGDEKVDKKALKAESLAELRIAIDNVLAVKFDPDDRLDALNSVSRQLEKARERYAEKFNEKDKELFQTMD